MKIAQIFEPAFISQSLKTWRSDISENHLAAVVFEQPFAKIINGAFYVS